MVVLYKDSLWLLLVLVPVLVLLVRTRNASLVQTQMLCGSQWIRKQGRLLRAKLLITSVATLLMFCLIVLAYVDIYFGKTNTRRERSGVEVGFLVDISNSMLATDVYPSRIQQAQVLIRSIVNYFPDLWYSLSVFKGNAITMIPTTQDRLLLQQTVQRLSPDIVSTPGSNLAEGIKTAIRSNSSSSNRNQIIVILSDGEQVNSNGKEALNAARSSGKKFILVAIGTEEGGSIQLDEQRYVTTKNGELVITRLNKTLLELLATASGGLFVEGSNEDSFSTIVSYIDSLRNNNTLVEQGGAARYRLFIAGAFLCLVFIVSIGVIPWRR